MATWSVLRELPDVLVLKRLKTKVLTGENCPFPSLLAQKTREFLELEHYQETDLLFLIGPAELSEDVVVSAAASVTLDDPESFSASLIHTHFTTVTRISKLLVHPTARSQGFGTKLLSAILCYAGQELALLQRSKDYCLSKMKQTERMRQDLLRPPFAISAAVDLPTLKLLKRLKFIPVLLDKSKTSLHVTSVFLPEGSGELVADSCKTLCANFLDQLVSSAGDSVLAGTPAKILSGLVSLCHSHLQSSPLLSGLDPHTLPFFLNSYDLERLAQNVLAGGFVNLSRDLAGDLWPVLALLFFRGHCQAALSSETTVGVSALELNPIQKAVLMGFGLQRKKETQLCRELKLSAQQVRVQFHICLQSYLGYLTNLSSSHIVKAADDHFREQPL